MKTLFILLTLALVSIQAANFQVGQFTGDFAHSANVDYSVFPFKKRVKTYFYSQPDGRKIQGIQALDNLHSKSSVNITAGGVGHSFVNLRFKSERGGALSYSVGIYVEPVRYQ